MDTSIIVNIVIILTAAFMAFTFLQAMWPIIEAIQISRARTQQKLDAIRGQTYVAPEKKEKKSMFNQLLDMIKPKGKKKVIELKKKDWAEKENPDEY